MITADDLLKALAKLRWGFDVPAEEGEAEYEGPTYEAGLSAGEFYDGQGHPQLVQCRWDRATHVCVTDHEGKEYYPRLADYFDKGDVIWQDGGDRWAFAPGEEAERASWFYDGEKILEATDEAWAGYQALVNARVVEKARGIFEGQDVFIDPKVMKALLKGKAGRRVGKAGHRLGKAHGQEQMLKAYMEMILAEENAKQGIRPPYGEKEGFKILREAMAKDDPIVNFFPKPRKVSWTVYTKDCFRAGTPQAVFDFCMRKFEEGVSKIAADVMGQGWPLEFGDLVLGSHDMMPQGLRGHGFVLEWRPKGSPVQMPSSEVDRILGDPENAVKYVRKACEKVAKNEMAQFVDAAIHHKAARGPAS
ncbi:MAG: hypothetical protein ACE5F1_00995 [Planctomycetota bacterium]